MLTLTITTGILYIPLFKSALFPQEEKELGERRAAELTCLTGLFILRRTQEVINKYLPPKIESVVFCRPGALQVELYQELLSSQSVRFCLQGLSENHLVCIGALKKLCNHPCLLFRPVKVCRIYGDTRLRWGLCGVGVPGGRLCSALAFVKVSNAQWLLLCGSVVECLSLCHGLTFRWFCVILTNIELTAEIIYFSFYKSKTWLLHKIWKIQKIHKKKINKIGMMCTPVVPTMWGTEAGGLLWFWDQSGLQSKTLLQNIK